MMGALLSFCVAVGALLLWLMNTYDGDPEQPKEQQGGQQSGRKRNRRKGGKKATGKGQQPARPTDDAADKRAIPTATPAPGSRSIAPVLNSEKSSNSTGGGGDGGGGKKQRSSRARGVPKQQKLDVNEWPTPLGSRGGGGMEPSRPARASRRPDEEEEEEEEEEDLVALHAELLKASKASSNAAVAVGKGGGGNGGTAGPGGGKTGIIGVGDKVDGRFEAGVEWFPAIVTKTLHGGLVNLLYDDGERETRVSLSLVRHRGARERASPGSDSVSDSDSEEEPARAYHNVPVAGGSKARGKGWEVITQKAKKTSQERVESRVEASSNLKNRIKRQKKREKEVAAREALRKKL